MSYAPMVLWLIVCLVHLVTLVIANDFQIIPLASPLYVFDGSWAYGNEGGVLVNASTWGGSVLFSFKGIIVVNHFQLSKLIFFLQDPFLLSPQLLIQVPRSFGGLMAPGGDHSLMLVHQYSKLLSTMKIIRLCFKYSLQLGNLGYFQVLRE